MGAGAMSNLVGQTLGQYQIVDKIGRGGMANVYRAVQSSIGREVAVKVLPPEFLRDQTFLSRFTREVEVIASLQHPHILPVYDFGEQDGLPFIVMAYLPGGSLVDVIHQYGEKLPLDQVADYIRQIAGALDFAHRKGIIHRDLKPNNVLLDEQGHAYLADFGIAWIEESTAHLTGSSIIGTPAYVAPEMANQGGVSPLVDVYALAVTLYQLVTGRLPYQAETPMGVLMAHLSKPIPDARVHRPDLPDAVQAVIQKGMSKDPAQRYGSCMELAKDLSVAILSDVRSGLADMTTLVDRTPPPDGLTMDIGSTPLPAPVRQRGSLPVIWWVIAGVIIVAGIVTLIAFGLPPKDDQSAAIPTAVETAAPVSNTEAATLPPPSADLPNAAPLPVHLPEVGTLPEGAFNRLGKGTILDIALSPDGSILAVGGSLGVYFYQTGGYKPIWLGETTGPVEDLAFSADGTTIAAASDKFIVWDNASGEQQFSYDAWPYIVDQVALSPDGSLLAGSEQGGTELLIWDLTGASDNAEPQTLEEAHERSLTGIAFSPDGSKLITGSDDGTAIIWDVAELKPLVTLRGHTDSVEEVIWSPGGDRVATGSSDGSIMIWDAASGDRLNMLTGSGFGIYSLAWSSDGGTLVSGEYTSVLVWDVTSGDLLLEFDSGHTDSVDGLALSPDGTTLYTGAGDGMVIEWDVATGKKLNTLGGFAEEIECVAFSPDGKMLAASSRNGITLLWDVATGEYLRGLESSFSPGSLAFSPDGSLLAMDSGSDILIWNPEIGGLIDTFEGDSYISDIAWSPDGDLIATALADNIGLWDTTTGEIIQTLEGHEATINAVRWSPDGQMLASVADDGIVFLWDRSTGQIVHRLEGHTDNTNTLAFSLDGKMLAAAGWDDLIDIWDTQSGELIRAFGGPESTVNSIDLSPDGRLLASGSWNNLVILWDVETGNQVRTLEGHTGAVQEVAFSPDGVLLASASDDGTVILWKVE